MNGYTLSLSINKVKQLDMKTNRFKPLLSLLPFLLLVAIPVFAASYIYVTPPYATFFPIVALVAGVGIALFAIRGFMGGNFSINNLIQIGVVVIVGVTLVSVLSTSMKGDACLLWYSTENNTDVPVYGSDIVFAADAGDIGCAAAYGNCTSPAPAGQGLQFLYLDNSYTENCP
jgi:hypothetical protein